MIFCSTALSVWSTEHGARKFAPLFRREKLKKKLVKLKQKKQISLKKFTVGGTSRWQGHGVANKKITKFKTPSLLEFIMSDEMN